MKLKNGTLITLNKYYGTLEMFDLFDNEVIEQV